MLWVERYVKRLSKTTPCCTTNLDVYIRQNSIYAISKLSEARLRFIGVFSSLVVSVRLKFAPSGMTPIRVYRAPTCWQNRSALTGCLLRGQRNQTNKSTRTETAR